MLRIVTLLLLFCTSLTNGSDKDPMNSIAEAYVRLVLAVGQHDADYVDAYYGPPEWMEKAKTEKMTLAEIQKSAEGILSDLQRIGAAAHLNEKMAMRHTFLTKQLRAVVARVRYLRGEKMTFDEESLALYDGVAPTYSESHFKTLIKELDALLPGEGSLTQRFEDYRKQFIIPPDKLDAVFTAAINEARKRTKEYVTLPADEDFTVEYVTGKSWSAYNWYKGGHRSLIQVNTQLPIYIERAIDLAAHEGYPGHHVYNVLLETNLLEKNKWVEFSVYPLFSPQSLIAEGSANYGKEVAFPRTSRLQFEKEVLFPLAGLDPREAEKYYNILSVVEKLSYAGNEAARGYLDGRMTREQARQWIIDYSLYSPERAEQRMKFIEQYRSYVINYNYGEDLVKHYIESRGGTDVHPQQRWELFVDLLSSLRLASDLM